MTSRVIPAPSPVPRRMIDVSGVDVLGHLDADGRALSFGTFTVLSYNILADSYATSDLYSYCPSWALSWPYRKQNLLREIIGYQADIICLQEVQSNHFEDFFAPELDKHGYQSLFKKKTSEVYSGNPNSLDGCATFFRRDRFSHVKKYEVEFNKAAQSLTDAVIPTGQKRVALNRLIKDNIALIAVLEAKFANHGAENPGKRQLLCVDNIVLSFYKKTSATVEVEKREGRFNPVMEGIPKGGGGWMADEAVAGNRGALEALRELIVYPYLYAHISRKLGLKWPRGLLLYGPPGTGKTSLVQAVVRESDAHLTTINAYSVHKPHAGESEKSLREAFAEAYSHASTGRPSVIFIDEIDAVCPRRDSRKEQESRVVGQLLTLMDGIKDSSKPLPRVVVVASTNRVDAIDPALRRPGRFDAEIEVGVPTVEERLKILELYSRNLKLGDNVDLKAVAKSCNGYVGADLEALCREAARLAHRRLSDCTKEMLTLTMDDFEDARAEVGPSITRGITKEISKVTWDDIGGLKELKRKLQQAVEWPIKHANSFARLGISPIRGVLLHGPPGCSKTTLAKAAAHAARASFFSLSGAELYSKYVGEGEALLRRTFQKARLAAPSVLFFDEADAIAPKRGSHDGNSSGNVTVGERLLSTLLTEMDGLELATGIIVLAATNRPHAIDAALLRPGRFDLVLYVPPPDAEGRLEILRIQTRKMNLGSDVDLELMAEATDLFTGADLQGLCREAGMVALREDIAADAVHDRHFQAARASLRPSLTTSMVEEYSRAKLQSRG